MGVYIKGMEIPINCMGCPFAFPGVDCAYCNAPNFEESMIIEFKDATKRQEFCPLVEVPTPHGRLIDADEAYDEIAEQKALTVQNETIQREEEAKQKVIAAQAEADATLLKAQAEAEANKLLNDSLTGNLLEYYKIQAWGGEFPQVLGSDTDPFVILK